MVNSNVCIQVGRKTGNHHILRSGPALDLRDLEMTSQAENPAKLSPADPITYAPLSLSDS